MKAKPGGHRIRRVLLALSAGANVLILSAAPFLTRPFTEAPLGASHRRHRYAVDHHNQTAWGDGHGGETILRGPIIDQAALDGILTRICDLGLSLTFFRRME